MASLFSIPLSLRSPTNLGRLVRSSRHVPQPFTNTSRLVSRYTSSYTRPQQKYRLPRKSNCTRTYSTVVVQDRPRGRTRRILTTVFLGLGSFIFGGYFALSSAPPYLTALVMGSMPTDEDTLKYEAPDEWTKEIDEHIKNCALAKYARAQPELRESRPHLKIPDEVRHHNLTAGTLSGPNMIPVPPYYFNEKDGKSMICIFYVGTNVSGHPGIVHGGFLATMMDEGLARCAFPAMPNKVGVTANLNVNYKRPTMASQFLVLRAETTGVEGRKATATGFICSLDECSMGEDGQFQYGPHLVQANALFLEPKHAKVLKSLYRQAT